MSALSGRYLTLDSLDKESQVLHVDSFAAHAQLVRPGRQVDCFGHELCDVADGSHANSDVRLIRLSISWYLGAHPRTVEHVGSFAVIASVPRYEGSREASWLESFVEDAAYESGVLDVVPEVMKPIEGGRS